MPLPAQNQPPRWCISVFRRSFLRNFLPQSSRWELSNTRTLQPRAEIPKLKISATIANEKTTATFPNFGVQRLIAHEPIRLQNRQPTKLTIFQQMRHPSSQTCRHLALLFASIAAAMTPSHASDAPPSLEIRQANRSQPNQIELGFQKPPGFQFFVEESNHLSRWNYLPSFWVGDGSRQSLVLPQESPGRFFRLSAYPIPEQEWATATANTSNAAYRLFYSNAIRHPVSYFLKL